MFLCFFRIHSFFLLGSSLLLSLVPDISSKYLRALVPFNLFPYLLFSAYPKVISLCIVIENVNLISEDPGFDPVEISPADSEEQEYMRKSYRKSVWM
jgi:hypothetical protein